MVGAVEKELSAYLGKMNDVQKKSLLAFIKTMFVSELKGTITVAQYNEELDRADAAIERGEYSTNEAVFSASKKMIDDHKKNKVG